MKSKTSNWKNQTASQAVKWSAADGDSAQRSEQAVSGNGAVSIHYERPFNGYVTNYTWE